MPSKHLPKPRATQIALDGSRLRPPQKPRGSHRKAVDTTGEDVYLGDILLGAASVIDESTCVRVRDKDVQ
eukprot:3140742-Pleurochrysis_carterae.AAC.2